MFTMLTVPIYRVRLCSMSSKMRNVRSRASRFRERSTRYARSLGPPIRKKNKVPKNSTSSPYGRRQERQTSLDEVGDVDLQARISSFASRNDILQIVKCRDRTFQDLELV